MWIGLPYGNSAVPSKCPRRIHHVPNLGSESREIFRHFSANGGCVFGPRLGANDQFFFAASLLLLLCLAWGQLAPPTSGAVALLQAP
jgi:hypothetical protein